jgi:hypothetical protein
MQIAQTIWCCQSNVQSVDQIGLFISSPCWLLAKCDCRNHVFLQARRVSEGQYCWQFVRGSSLTPLGLRSRFVPGITLLKQFLSDVQEGSSTDSWVFRLRLNLMPSAYKYIRSNQLADWSVAVLKYFLLNFVVELAVSL